MEHTSTFRTWGSEVLRHWLARDARNVHSERELQQLERIASCACSGYFHSGYTPDAFVFNAELPLRD